MFSSRQYEEVNPLVEISFAVITPGAVGNSTIVATATAFQLTAAGSAVPASFALGDQLEIFPSAAAACNGVNVSAVPTATPGTAEVYFQNNTGGSITPVAGAKYTIVASRLPATLVS
jgi:hypothetical protein